MIVVESAEGGKQGPAIRRASIQMTRYHKRYGLSRPISDRRWGRWRGQI
jgi:hypothetical protein